MPTYVGFVGFPMPILFVWIVCLTAKKVIDLCLNKIGESLKQITPDGPVSDELLPGRKARDVPKLTSY